MSKLHFNTNNYKLHDSLIHDAVREFVELSFTDQSKGQINKHICNIRKDLREFHLRPVTRCFCVWLNEKHSVELLSTTEPPPPPPEPVVQVNCWWCLNRDTIKAHYRDDCRSQLIFGHVGQPQFWVL